MRVLSKSLKVVLLGTTLMTSAKASDLSLTVDDYAVLADRISVGSAEADKAVEIASVVGSGLDKGLMGTVVASNPSFVHYNSVSSRLKVLAIIAGKWCTFESAGLSAIGSSGPIDLFQTKEDGSNVITKKFTINLTKTTGSSLSPVALANWLRTALTSSNKSFSAGSLKSLTAPATGWTATALFQDSSDNNLAADALAAVLDPIAFTLTVPVTPAAGGAAVNYTGSVTDISAYNVALNDNYSAPVALTNGANTLTFALKPGKIASHATSIMDGLVSDANDLVRKRLKTSSPYTYLIPSDAASSVVAEIGAGSPVSIADDLAAQHARLVGSPTTIKADIDALEATIGSTGTVEARLGNIVTELGASPSVSIADDLAAQHARLVTNPNAAPTDTVKEAIDVLESTIGSSGTLQARLGNIVTTIGATSSVSVAADLTAQHARLVATPSTVKADIDAIQAKIGSMGIVEARLGNLVTTIGATSSVSIADDLAAQHARLVGSPTTIKADIDAIQAKIGSSAAVDVALGDIVILLGGSNLKDGLKVVAKGYVDAALFTFADCTQNAAPEGVKYGAVAFTSADITNLTNWKSTGSTVEVSGKISGADRTFTCSVAGLETFKTGGDAGVNKTVLEFSSSEGDVFWIKAFDVTGLDASTFAVAAFKDDYLAMLIAAKFSGVTGITTLTLPALRTAAAS